MRRYTAEYVNEPAWTEPLRMVAETLGTATADAKANNSHVRAGRQLVEFRPHVLMHTETHQRTSDQRLPTTIVHVGVSRSMVMFA